MNVRHTHMKRLLTFSLLPSLLDTLQLFFVSFLKLRVSIHYFVFLLLPLLTARYIFHVSLHLSPQLPHSNSSRVTFNTPSPMKITHETLFYSFTRRSFHRLSACRSPSRAAGFLFLFCQVLLNGQLHWKEGGKRFIRSFISIVLQVGKNKDLRFASFHLQTAKKLIPCVIDYSMRGLIFVCSWIC